MNHSHVGTRYGRLTIVEQLGSLDYNGKPKMLCHCDCGNAVVVSWSNLNRTRFTKSCGCKQKEAAKKAKQTHAKFYTSTYKVWHNMLQRCFNPNNSAYKYYGGRGIKVCDRWQKFENFLDDMGERPENLTLDRIDNNRHYSPKNCRWATMKQQVENRNQRGFLHVS